LNILDTVVLSSILLQIEIALHLAQPLHAIRLIDRIATTICVDNQILRDRTNQILQRINARDRADCQLGKRITTTSTMVVCDYFWEF
jgi:hypothetical protein